ncbi:hypothetical protein [Helicobacter turcicus]|uniref:Uncharacterized protein n=1 Tax=Helicobacter turcicus TaxID=2867412 RepID=A0ABS7JPD2_9HELI|nr:hypothetical protein [Helicobacter turcicus]MBX7491222.1 hypothetical protein [Helicobacter turcicus]MBX7546139.1 hypothetical protein [Helicobacter turcicus]
MDSTNKDFFDKITDLALKLQKEVAELKEDTLVNASHIALLKNSNKEHIEDLNTNLSELNNATSEFVSGVEKEFNKKSGDNYTEFLKSLLKEDFLALQKEMIEDSKREILNAKGGAKAKQKENILLSFLGFLSPILSLISFSLLMLICVKFKIFGMLF